MRTISAAPIESPAGDIAPDRDGRSLFLNQKVTTAFYGQTQIAWLSRWTNKLSDQSKPYVSVRPSGQGNLTEGVVLAVAYQI
ncbi:MAG: hypothetical protein WBD13_07490 [Burkholderiaceae bacterium]